MELTTISVIEFGCWDDDEPTEIQLEPEAIIFIVSKDINLRFVATSVLNDFKWVLRIDHNSKWLQLFPESAGAYVIEIFENNKLLEGDEWYKYM